MQITVILCGSFIVCFLTKVYEFLDGVPSYTELLRENRLGDVDCSGDKKIWRIVTLRPLYKSGKACFIMLVSASWNGNIWAPTD